MKKDRLYADAVKAFEPYQLRPGAERRSSQGDAQIAEAAVKRKKPAFLFVNNRLEGNAPGTIEAILS